MDVSLMSGHLSMDVSLMSGHLSMDVSLMSGHLSMDVSLMSGQVRCKVVPLVFMYLVFTRTPGENYRRRLMSLLLYLFYVF